MTEIKNERMVEEVSIPYRYATNGKPSPRDFLKKGGFQSLIGTLQTKGRKRICSYVHLFQSLIGTLQTDTIFAFIFLLPVVSIPYRYATNCYNLL